MRKLKRKKKLSESKDNSFFWARDKHGIGIIRSQFQQMTKQMNTID